MNPTPVVLHNPHRCIKLLGSYFQRLQSKIPFFVNARGDQQHLGFSTSFRSVSLEESLGRDQTPLNCFRPGSLAFQDRPSVQLLPDKLGYSIFNMKIICSSASQRNNRSPNGTFSQALWKPSKATSEERKSPFKLLIKETGGCNW